MSDGSARQTVWEAAGEIDALCVAVASRVGARLSRPQRGRLEREITRRLAGRTPAQYLAWIQSGHEAELDRLAAVLSVLKTELFRDPDQLAAVVESVLRPLAAAGRPLRAWSAGCATGEEVATLLVLFAEAGAHPGSTVLGTDLSDEALQAARTLTFTPRRLAWVPPALRRRYFSREGAAGGDRTEALIPSLRARASFLRHNLMDEPYPTAPDGGPFDVVFCRNVLIYLADAAVERVLRALAASLAPGGALVVSAAEPILGPVRGLIREAVGETVIWRRTPGGLVSTNGSAPPRAPTPPGPRERAGSPRQRAERLFQQLLEGTDLGGANAEQTLRECVALDATFAQARYLLGLLLERRGEGDEARRHLTEAARALGDGPRRAAPFPFFLNDERLRRACAAVVERIDRRR